MCWRIFKTAAGFNSLENFFLPCKSILKIVSFLEAACGAKAEHFPLNDEMIVIELLIEGERLTAGWDELCGCFFMSDTEKGDFILHQLHDCLNELEENESNIIYSKEYPPIDIFKFRPT